MTTTGAFLSAVRRTAGVADSTVPGDQDADLLAYGDEEIQGRMLPLVMSNRDEFYVAYKDYSVTSGTSKYQIPGRAIGGKLRDVVLVVNGQLNNLTRLEPEELTCLSTVTTGQPTKFYIENAHLVLVPTPNASCTLRVKYFTTPGELVVEAAALTSTAVSVTAGIATVTVVAPVSQAYDIISANSPYPLMAADTVVSSVTGTTYLFTFAGESQYFANSQINYLCNPGKSPVIQLPKELFATLVQRTAARYLEAKGAANEAKVCEMRAEQLEKAAMMLLTPRVDGEPKRMSPGPLFQGNGWNGWGYYR